MTLVISSLCAFYSLVANRTSSSYTRFEITRQSQRMMQQLEDTIGNSNSCVVVTRGSNNCLKCTQPATLVDNNSDGIGDGVKPARITRRGYDVYGAGNRVWFYKSDSTYSVSTPGNYFVMAVRSDDSDPTSANAKTAFTVDSAGNSNFASLDTLTFNVNSNYTVRVDALFTANKMDYKVAGNAETTQYDSLTTSRIFFMKGWHQ